LEHPVMSGPGGRPSGQHAERSPPGRNRENQGNRPPGQRGANPGNHPHGADTAGTPGNRLRGSISASPGVVARAGTAYLEYMNRLGELERAIMEVLWESVDPMTVRQVGNCLVDRDLAHTTVMTVLDRLAKKGFVRRQRVGRAWRYRPAESREACVAELMLTALDQTGDRQAALTRFARSVSGDEARALRAALETLSGADRG
jgi:predicted transcriptional regulator